MLIKEYVVVHTTSIQYIWIRSNYKAYNKYNLCRQLQTDLGQWLWHSWLSGCF